MFKNIITGMIGNIFLKILSLGRLHIELWLLKDSAIGDAYALTNRVLALLRRIFIDGSFEAIFTKEYIESNQKNNIFVTVIVKFGIILSLLAIFTAIIGYPFANIFRQDIIFPFTFFMLVLSPIIFLMFFISIFRSVLNSHGYYKLTSFAPSIANICFILILYIIGIKFGNTLVAFGIGGLFYSLIQVLIMLPIALKFMSGGKIEQNLPSDLKNKILHNSFVSLSIPSVEFLVHYLANKFKTGTVSLIHYGHKINYFFFSIFGVAISAVLTPVFAKLSNQEENKRKEFASKCILASHTLVIIPTIFIVTKSQYVCDIIFSASKQFSDPTALASAVTFSGFGIYSMVQMRCLSSLALAYKRKIGIWANLIYSSIELCLATLFYIFHNHIAIPAHAAFSLFCPIGEYAAVIFLFYVCRDLLNLSYNYFFKMLISIFAGFTFPKLYDYINIFFNTATISWKNYCMINNMHITSYLIDLFVLTMPFLLLYIIYLVIFLDNIKIFLQKDDQLEN